MVVPIIPLSLLRFGCPNALPCDMPMRGKKYDTNYNEQRADDYRSIRGENHLINLILPGGLINFP
jgi:hypothetical protein